MKQFCLDTMATLGGGMNLKQWENLSVLGDLEGSQKSIVFTPGIIPGTLPGIELLTRVLVVDEFGDPLRDVNVYLTRNSRVGTITDRNGNANIGFASPEDQITFSHVGHETRVIKARDIGHKVVMNIAVEGLPEVVVTASTPQRNPPSTPPANTPTRAPRKKSSLGLILGLTAGLWVLMAAASSSSDKKPKKPKKDDSILTV